MSEPKRIIRLGRYQSFRFPQAGGVGSWGFVQLQIDGLIWYLNERNIPGQERVLAILEKMIELANIEPPVFNEKIDGPALVRGKPNPVFRKIAPEKYDRQMRIEKLRAELNAELAQYKFIPFVLTSLGARGLSVAWHRFWRFEMEEPRTPPNKLMEGQYLEMILNLARSGQIRRLRRCSNCGKWLYARFRHQEFCSTKCQQKHYTQTEEWKAHRREYMRDYYQKTYGKRRKK